MVKRTSIERVEVLEQKVAKLEELPSEVAALRAFDVDGFDGHGGKEQHGRNGQQHFERVEEHREDERNQKQRVHGDDPEGPFRTDPAVPVT